MRAMMSMARRNSAKRKPKGSRLSMLESRPARYPKGEETMTVAAMIRALMRARSRGSMLSCMRASLRGVTRPLAMAVATT